MVRGLTSGGGGGVPGSYQSTTFYGRVDGGPRGISVTAASRQGQTVLRLDAGAGWIYPRPAGEVVPAGVSEIDIHGGGVSRELRGADVARVVRWFDALNVVQPSGTVSCMINISVRVNFAFRSSSGAALASAVVPSEPADGCDPIEFSIGGKQQQGLIDAAYNRDAFIKRVQRLLGACFGAGPHGGQVSPSCNRAWAGHVAKQLLHRFVPPRDAQRLAREPAGGGVLLASPETTSGGSELVDRHQFWSVRAPFASVEAYVKTHQTRALHVDSTATGGPGVPPNDSLTFTYAARDVIVSSRQLEVTLVSLPHGWTGIRADAQVVWIYPRTNAQMAPAHTRVIIVRSGSTSRRITDYRTIERIVLRFDRLEVVQPGVVYHCPAVFPSPQVTLTFHAVNPAVTARAVARAKGFSSQCFPIHFAIHGLRVRLIGGNFVQWLEGVLGVRFR